MTSSQQQVLVGCTVLFLLSLLFGCQQGPPPIPMVELSGTVTLNGDPIPEGAIQFTPVDRDTPTTGANIKEGRFTAKVPRGVMKISVTASEVIGEKPAYDTPDSPMIEIREEIIPKKYNVETILEYDIQAPDAEFNLELESD